MIDFNIEDIVKDWENGIIDRSVDTELCKLYQKYGSDKKSVWHNYSSFYYPVFNKLKNNKINFFELGLGTNNTNVLSNMGTNGKPGASLYAAESFFTEARIYGADIDKRILFNTPRIKTFYCDQTDPQCIADMWNNEELRDKKMDIIIEDGLHTHEASCCFLNNSLDRLSDGGIYLAEDQHENSKELFAYKQDDIIKKYNLRYFTVTTELQSCFVVAQKKF